MNKERIKFLLQAAESGMIHGEYVPNLVDIQQLCRLALWAIEAKDTLENASQFCSWLCQDSLKYPETDAGRVAKRKRVDYQKTLAKYPGDL